MTRAVDAEWLGVAGGVALVVIGELVGGTLLALVGALAALTSLLLLLWQRHCLTGVRYARHLAQARAAFGERVALDIELVNDKLLPLTWLHLADEVPAELTVEGASLSGDSEWRREVNVLLPMLPYQRVRRHLTVVCDHRGEHHFGPAILRSGNPVGQRQEQAKVPGGLTLLVYPKVLALASPVFASRVPTGDSRARYSLVTDPSRVIGVRAYRPGDPLRHIDWRATARSADLLVRELEPATTLRVAVFADLRLPMGSPLASRQDALEYIVAVTASVVADLVGRGIPTGLYAAATVGGDPVARPPSSAPDALTAMLELLARASPSSLHPIGTTLLEEQSRMRPGTSVVVIAAHFPAPTLVALSELRRRAAVTSVWVAAGAGSPPPPGLVDTRREVSYDDGWKDRSVLDLA